MKSSMTSVGVAAALILFAGMVLAADDDFEPVRVLCLERNNISENEFEALQEAESLELPAIDARFKCFAHCVVDEMGYLDEEGKLDLTKIEQDDKVNEDHMATIMECKAKHDLIEDPCEYSFQMMTCAMESM